MIGKNFTLLVDSNTIKLPNNLTWSHRLGNIRRPLNSKRISIMSSFEAELRAEVKDFLQKHDHKLDKDRGKFLQLLPDFYRLLQKLANDKKIDSRIAAFCQDMVDYIESPVDILPEAVLGTIGYFDDLVVSIFALDSVQNWFGDAKILKSYWEGEENIVQIIEAGIEQIDNFVPMDIFHKIVQWVGNRSIDQGLRHKS